MRVIDRDPYTLTVVAVDNVSGTIADFTSTLEVMVDDIEDGTTIACDVFDDEDQLTISKTSKASVTKYNVKTCLQVPHLHHLM